VYCSARDLADPCHQTQPASSSPFPTRYALHTLGWCSTLTHTHTHPRRTTHGAPLIAHHSRSVSSLLFSARFCPASSPILCSSRRFLTSIPSTHAAFDCLLPRGHFVNSPVIFCFFPHGDLNLSPRLQSGRAPKKFRPRGTGMALLEPSRNL